MSYGEIMNYLILVLTIFTSVSYAGDCPPLSVQGNQGWLNNQVYATADKDADIINYSYMMSTLNDMNSHLYYGFSLDFADILESLDPDKSVDIFELYVLPIDYVSPNLIDDKVLSISIAKEKVVTNLAGSGSFNWALNFIWTDLMDQFGNVQVIESQKITFNGDITEGLVHIDVDWTNNNLQGGSANISVYSNIFKTNPNSGNDETVLLTSDDGVNVESKLQRVVKTSDHFIKNVVPSLFKVGIINPDSGVSFGDGITFYTPWRE